jgi:eukaryotic-like serine/threonine-protein kinase
VSGQEGSGGGSAGGGGNARKSPGQPRHQPRTRSLIAAISLTVAVVGGGLSVVKLIKSGHSVPRPPAAVQTVPPPATAMQTIPPPSPAGTPTLTPSAAPTPSPSPSATTAATDPQQVVQAYYAAINAHDYMRAWELGGKNLGASYSSFASGFSNTASDSITTTSVSGDTVSIQLDATQTDGSHRYFTITYTVQNGEIVSASAQAQ